MTAPTAAMAIPITINASFSQLKPFFSMSKKFVMAMIAPPITAAIPPTVEPMLAITDFTVENTEPILDMIPASFGNSSARTSEKVPAPPDRSWNPSTSFGTTPIAAFMPPDREFIAETTPLILAAAAFAVCIVTIAAAMVPIAFPRASKVAGSASLKAPNMPSAMLTTPDKIGSRVEVNPSNNPLKNAPRFGNSSLIP